MTQNSLSCKSNEAFFLAVLMLTTRLCTNIPLIFTQFSGTGAPLSAVLSGLVVLILICFIIRKFYATTCGNIIQKTQKLLGAPGKYLISLVLLAYLFISSAYLLEQFSYFAKNLAFPTAPLWFVAIFFVFGAICGALCGLKRLLRITRIAVPLFVAVFVLLIVSVLWGCDFSNIFPISGNGVVPALRGGLWGTSIYSDALLIFLINPFSNSPKTTGRALRWGCAVAVLINILLVLTFTSKIPYPLSLQEQFPLYILSKEVYFGRFFQRIDALLLLFSALCNMLTLAFNLGLIAKIMEQTFDVSSHRITIISSALTIFLFVSGTTILSQQLFGKTLPYLGTVLIAIALLTAIFTRKEAKVTNEE